MAFESLLEEKNLLCLITEALQAGHDDGHLLPDLGVVLPALLRGDDRLGDVDGGDHPSGCQGPNNLGLYHLEMNRKMNRND